MGTSWRRPPQIKSATPDLGPSSVCGFLVLEEQGENVTVGTGQVMFLCGLRGEGLAGPPRPASCQEGNEGTVLN